ncbi:hypothetical protein ACO0RG_000965 [Hanseniaspora osmophila]|uniref:Uncharacterized protein n=1 Tax=Hanseniaspora osmophila TaxID=56408 RepID=A0A1E5RP30_9ASCO|nr:hypothetical protein AWRI3579_g605 [Hanseniaspora osmophila]
MAQLNNNVDIIWPTENDRIIRTNQTLQTIRYLVKLGNFASLIVSIVYLAFRNILVPNYEKLLEQRSDFNRNTLFALRKTLARARKLMKDARASETPTDENQFSIFTNNRCKTYIERIKAVNLSIASESEEANSLQTAFQNFAENLHNMQYRHNKDKFDVLKKSNAIVADLRTLKGKIIKEGLA